MAVESIDPALCNGCGNCVKSCPMDVFRLDKDCKKARIQYPEDCMLCGWCLMDCPQDAISVTLDKKSPLLVSWG
jgi:NAD-dependent dihydropyrimidine dehydrogenase PreA subunit